MDPLYDDPDARPRRLAVLAGFGIIIATGFATIAAMALDDGQNQQDTALPDSVITTSSSTPPGDSAHFRTADRSATGTSRPDPSRDSPAESSGGDVPEGTNSATGEPRDTDEPGEHPAPGDSEGDDGGSGNNGDGGDDGGGDSDDPSGDHDPPAPTETSSPDDSDETSPKDPPESSTSSETSSSESTTSSPSESSSEGSSSRAASSGLTSTRESTDRGPTA